MSFETKIILLGKTRSLFIQICVNKNNTEKTNISNGLKINVLSLRKPKLWVILCVRKQNLGNDMKLLFFYEFYLNDLKLSVIGGLFGGINFMIAKFFDRKFW